MENTAYESSHEGSSAMRASLWRRIIYGKPHLSQIDIVNELKVLAVESHAVAVLW